MSFEKIAAILAITGVILGATWKIACWKTKNECKISELESRVKNNDGMNPHFILPLPKQNTSNYKESTTPKKTENKPFFSGQLAIINKNIVHDKLSSFKFPYLLDCNICEYNDRYTKWNVDNPIPKPLFFYKLISKNKSLVSWCVVIGKFNSIAFPNRAFLVSEKVANELGFTLRKGVTDVTFTIMDVDEWSRNEQCCNTRNRLLNIKAD